MFSRRVTILAVALLASAAAAGPSTTLGTGPPTSVGAGPSTSLGTGPSTTLGTGRPTPGAKRPASSAIKIPFETYTLPNRLTVILSPDHTTPTVAVDVRYHGRSQNDLPGRTGFGHLVEHVRFTGW